MHLYVGRRDETKAVEAMAKQTRVVSDALRGLPSAANVKIEPMLVFVHADWGWSPKPFHVGNVWVGPLRAMAKHVGRPGPLDEATVRAIAERLATALGPA